MKQFFGIYSKEERCRFFKCDEGTITSENVETNCVFQGSFPWKPLQTLMATGKKHIMKACTTSYLKTVKNCEQGLGEEYILNNLKWIEDCTLDPSCQAVSQVSCSAGACSLTPDSCTSEAGSSDQSSSEQIDDPSNNTVSSSHPDPSPSSPPHQVPPGKRKDQTGNQESSGYGEDDDGLFSLSGDEETEHLDWQEQVHKNMKKFLIDDGENGDDDSSWNDEGRRLMIMAMERPVDQMTIKDVWSTGVESIRMSGELGQQIHHLQQQIDDMSTWSWRFNLGLLLPTSLAVATSLLILGNFCYKSQKYIADKVNKAWTEKSAQKVLRSEKAKNEDALDVAIRIESMKMQMDEDGHSDTKGIIRLSDCDGRPLGTYNPTQILAAIPEHVQPINSKKEPALTSSSPPPKYVSTQSFVVNEYEDRQRDKIVPREVFLQNDDRELTMEAWMIQVTKNLSDDNH